MTRLPLPTRSAIVLLCTMAGLCFCPPAKAYEAAAAREDSLRLRADSLIDCGLERYGAGNYGEALALLEACDSIEAQLDSMSYIRAHTLQWLALCYYHVSRYSEAINTAGQALQLLAQTQGTESSEYATILYHLSVFHSSMGNYAEAIQLSEQVLTLRSDEEGEETVAYASALDNTARLYALMGEYAKAIELCEQALNIYDEQVGKEYAGYPTALGNLSLYLSYMGNYTEAISLCEEALALCDQLESPDQEERAALLTNLANYQSHIADFSQAIALAEEALSTASADGSDGADIATLLNNLAYIYAAKGDYTQAIALCAQALEMCERMASTNSDIYATTLDNLAQYYVQTGEYQQAWQLACQAQALRLQIFGTLHVDYAASLSTMALCLSCMGQSTDALELARQATEVYARTVGENHHEYASSLCNLASYLVSVTGDYQEAIALCQQAVDILAERLGRTHPSYATALDDLAHYYACVSNYADAMDLCQQAAEIRRQALGERHPDYATSLSNLAYYYSCVGNYEKAVTLCSQAQEIRGTLSTATMEYANLLDNMARYQYYLDDYEAAISLCQQSIELREQLSGKEHPAYVNALSNMGIYLSANGEYDDAISIGEQALALRESISGKEHPDYATALDNLASYHAGLGDFAVAAEQARQALDIRESVLGTKHTDYILSLGKLATYYFYLNDTAALDHYTSQMTSSTAQLVKSTFTTLTSYERELFWQMYADWFSHFIHYFAYGLPSDTLAINGYNSALLSKGLLLNSEIEFSRFIYESGDSAAAALYQDMCDLRTQANWQAGRYAYVTDVDSLHHLVDSLSALAQEREDLLLRTSSTYGDYTRRLVVTWDDVQAQLTDSDAAVEFVCFPWHGDSVRYAAYVMRKDLPPTTIPLFEQSELKALKPARYYNTSALAHLVWEPLQEVLAPVTRVYFSPDGMLYNIAIEALPAWDDSKQWVDEEREYFRLSSTRELALPRDTCLWQQAAVYGGLDYALSVADMVAADARYQRGEEHAAPSSSWEGTQLSNYNVLDTSATDEGLQRGWTLDSLPGTRQEALAIKESLDKIPIPTTLYTDSAGTEGSFKALSGERVSVIHVGTHGFFHETEEDTALPLTTRTENHVAGDEALTRTGLYFAGAIDAYLNRKTLPEGANDGQLTALEIAYLDLRGLDLAVLSACKTALGEISGEGVFGLQRGFKKAGTNAIVMSLWNVDDELTCQFMTLFFDNLVQTNGQNKHAAFVAAQQQLRRQTTDDPVLRDEWAAFILLDGL